VLELSAQYKIPIGAVCGICTLDPSELKSKGFAWVLEVSDANQSLAWNLTNAADRIEMEIEAFFKNPIQNLLNRE
jgi:glycerate kinase